MSLVDKPKRGRPRRYAPGKRPVITVRVQEPLHANISKAAKAAGRSISEEAELRLRELDQWSEAFGGLEQTRTRVFLSYGPHDQKLVEEMRRAISEEMQRNFRDLRDGQRQQREAVPTAAFQGAAFQGPAFQHLSPESQSEIRECREKLERTLVETYRKMEATQDLAKRQRHRAKIDQFLVVLRNLNKRSRSFA
jgi:hypothetical protein